MNTALSIRSVLLVGFAICFVSPLVTANAAEKRALAVGVEQYLPDQLSSLEFADDDAATIGEALESLGFSVTTMTFSSHDPRYRSTTPERILEQLERQLANLGPPDTAVIAFSGRSVRFPDDNALCLCPAEARLTDRSTLVPFSRVLEMADACGAGHTLLLIDSNFDTPGGGPAGGFARPTALESPSLAVLWSCRPGEKSYEAANLGHGVFAHHVVEYLTGKAPHDRYGADRAVSVVELVRYVTA